MQENHNNPDTFVQNSWSQSFFAWGNPFNDIYLIPRDPITLSDDDWGV